MADNLHAQWDSKKTYGPAAGPNQTNLVERWRNGEILGDPEVLACLYCRLMEDVLDHFLVQVIADFTKNVLQVIGDDDVKVLAVFPMADGL